MISLAGIVLKIALTAATWAGAEPYTYAWDAPQGCSPPIGTGQVVKTPLAIRQRIRTLGDSLADAGGREFYPNWFSGLASLHRIDLPGPVEVFVVTSRTQQNPRVWLLTFWSDTRSVDPRIRSEGWRDSWGAQQGYEPSYYVLGQLPMIRVQEFNNSGIAGLLVQNREHLGTLADWLYWTFYYPKRNGGLTPEAFWVRETFHLDNQLEIDGFNQTTLSKESTGLWRLDIHYVSLDRKTNKFLECHWLTGSPPNRFHYTRSSYGVDSSFSAVPWDCPNNSPLCLTPYDVDP